MSLNFSRAWLAGTVVVPLLGAVTPAWAQESSVEGGTTRAQSGAGASAASVSTDEAAPATDPSVTTSLTPSTTADAARAPQREAVPATSVVVEPPVVEKKEESPVTFSATPGSGVTADFGDKFSLNIKSRIQVRYQLDIPNEGDDGERQLLQTVNIGTARLFFTGHMFTRKLNYVIQLAVAGRDFRDGATSPIFDAFLDWKLHRDFSVKVGQYFVPFDRLRTVREFALQMGDRPRPVQELTLDRDVGVTFYSDTFLGDHSPLAVRLGLFGGGGTNLSLGKEPGALAVGRLELRPLGEIDDDSEGDLKRREEVGLAIGVAGAVNWNTNRLRSTTGRTFAADVVDYRHAAIDAVLKWQGIALQAEMLWKDASKDELTGATPDVPEYSQSGHGWVLQASYTFDPPFEVVGRLSRLFANETTDPAFVSLVEATGQEVGAGLNYYINGHKFKVQTDWIARMPPGFVFDRAEQVAHLQVDATF